MPCTYIPQITTITVTNSQIYKMPEFYRLTTWFSNIQILDYYTTNQQFPDSVIRSLLFFLLF